MKVIQTYPQSFSEIENTWITLSDGCQLAAKIWLPEQANPEMENHQPVPAILEYLPYRKRDGTHERDAMTYPWYAGNGYAGIRVDMRGNGDSDGLMHDEYLLQEQDDALEVIEWLTQQPWCDGNVGMMGISWGGFNALQVAARKPKALKAIISLCSTDNRYTDDIHYKGGALLMENLGWASTMFSYSSRPPDAALRPDDWREVWLNRLENTPLLLEKWLQHPHHDELWKHGSIDENYADVEAATLLIGGWHDAYSNSIPRMLEHLECPRKGITGPWAHKYPHFAVPGPQVGFLQESLRWWDYWLKGIDNGIMDEPMYRAYMMDSVPPKPSYAERPGTWIGENQWPCENIESVSFYLSPKGLSQAIGESAEYAIKSPQDTGGNGGEYCIIWLGPDWPTDQRDDDARSLTFDADIMSGNLALFGAPVMHLELTADKPVGNITVKLCDVAPTGESTLITYGVLNLTHRNGHENPKPMTPGQTETIQFKLDDCGYIIPHGHRIRVSVATAHWPLIWPAGEDTTLTLHSPNSFIELPVFDQSKNQHQNQPVTLPEPLICQPYDQEALQPADSYRRVTKDIAGEMTQVEILNDFGKTKSNVHGLIKHETNHELHQINPADPNSAKTVITGMQSLQRDEWKVKTGTTTELTCDSSNFYIKANLIAYEGDKIVFERKWDTQVKRQL